MKFNKMDVINLRIAEKVILPLVQPAARRAWDRCLDRYNLLRESYVRVPNRNLSAEFALDTAMTAERLLHWGNLDKTASDAETVQMFHECVSSVLRDVKKALAFEEAARVRRMPKRDYEEF